MRYWLPQIALLAAVLLYLGQLSTLGSPVVALAASALGVGTVWAACCLVDLVRAEGLLSLRRALAPKAEA